MVLFTDPCADLRSNEDRLSRAEGIFREQFTWSTDAYTSSKNVNSPHGRHVSEVKSGRAVRGGRAMPSE